MVPRLNWRRKLTDSDDAAIAVSYRAGVDGTVLARQYGVAKNTIYVALSKLGVSRHRARINLALGVKRCAICRTYKPLDAFGVASGSAGLSSRRPYCRVYERARVKRLGYSRRWNTGMSRQQYDALFSAQCGVCAICERPQNNGPLHVDHDHSSLEIRGLLCRRCNALMGRLDKGEPIKAVDADEWRVKGEWYQQKARTGMLFVRGPKARIENSIESLT